MAATQKNRAIKVTSPLGGDALLFSEMSGHEQLSGLFSYEVSLLSESGDVDFDKVLGQPLCVAFQPDKGARRFIHGIAAEMAHVGHIERYHRYRVTLRPWLWLLTRTADCRIFQDQSVPEIFEAVAKEYGLTDYKLELKRSYPKWEYCVQYRETDFNFISRLLEQEGIYYYFRHQEGRHDLVLADDPSCHDKRAGYETVPYYPPGGNEGQRERDHFTGWSVAASVQPGAYALTDFSFQQPGKALLGKGTIKSSHARSGFEIFDYPAELQKEEAGETERIAKLRIEELHAAQRVARGAGDAGGLSAGVKFKLEKYPRADYNAEYLVTSSTLSLASNAYQSGAGGGEDELSMSIEAIRAATPFRPARLTPKPVVQGAQTAIVVGKSGEEIWTDEFGRIKVHFHWDRHGKRDEKSSCWVRVAQAWAGAQWGTVHVPRVGQEVIVSFLEGDPDQPIITGRVYNGANKPPYTLPANATQSGIKSRSSKSGSAENFNELRFEDKKGEEQVFLHAEKDLKTIVKHDEAMEIGNDSILKVKHNRTALVENDETVEVKKNRKAKVGGDEEFTVTKGRKESVGDNDSVKVGKAYVLEAGDQITLKTGSSQLVMKSDGTITLKGVKITIDGTQSVTAKGGTKVEIKGMEVAVKGTKTQVQGTLLDLKADGIATLKGALTKIG
jgi:type VI secretion system secreted protein VgrG